MLDPPVAPQPVSPQIDVVQLHPGAVFLSSPCPQLVDGSGDVIRPVVPLLPRTCLQKMIRPALGVEFDHQLGQRFGYFANKILKAGRRGAAAACAWCLKLTGRFW